MNNKIRVSKNNKFCKKNFKIRVEVPNQDFIDKLDFNFSKCSNHEILVNKLRHGTKVYVKIGGVRMRGLYDSICKSLSQNKYYELKEKIYSAICAKYPYLINAVYKQRCELNKRKYGGD
jgi:hypothetical protein